MTSDQSLSGAPAARLRRLTLFPWLLVVTVLCLLWQVSLSPAPFSRPGAWSSPTG